MAVGDEIESYIAAQRPAKAEDLRSLHGLILQASPGCELWFLDGRNADGKVVTNPNIGYGREARSYADGTTRDFYRLGVSANTTGISVYLMGLPDKDHLRAIYGARLGKATVTGYCVRFARLSDVDADVLREMIESHMGGG